jgi:hypothetical protein
MAAKGGCYCCCLPALMKPVTCMVGVSSFGTKLVPALLPHQFHVVQHQLVITSEVRKYMLI